MCPLFIIDKQIMHILPQRKKTGDKPSAKKEKIQGEKKNTTIKQEQNPLAIRETY